MMSGATAKVVEDCNYWLRCITILEVCVKGGLLEIVHDPARNGLPLNDEEETHRKLTLFKQNNAKKLTKVLHDCQWDKICHACNNACPPNCPKAGKTNTTDLDITSILVLIRSYLGLSAPATGWNFERLNANDYGLMACILRIREIRNVILGHGSHTLVMTQQEFDDVYQRIKKVLNGIGYKKMQLLNDLKTSPLEPYTRIQIEVLGAEQLEMKSKQGSMNVDLKKQINSFGELIQELTLKLKTIKEKQDDMQVIQADIRLKQDDMQTELNELRLNEGTINKEVKKLTADVNQMKSEHDDSHTNYKTGAELKERYRKYDRINLPLNPKATSLVCNDVIGREEIIVDLSIVPRTSSVFNTACDNQRIKRIRKEQTQIASDTASTTDYSKIVESKDDYVIISGVPGSGKTTLVQTILYKWALGELWQEFDYAFVIYLRDLVRFKNQDDVTANKMLTYYYPGYDITEVTRSGKAILILEGFDELYGKTELRSKEEEYSCYTRSIHDLFDPQNPSLPFTRLVTSRPGSCPILLETVLSENTNEKLFIVTGFSERNIQRYVENHLREKANVVINMLKDLPVVYDSMVVPFNCWGVCYLIKNGSQVEDFGQTVTSLYANLLTLFIRSHGLRNTKIKLKNVHANQKFKDICVGLSALAFQLEQTNKINFTVEDLPAGVSIETLVEDSGMIIEIDGEVDTYYQFLHYTFHELFVALHVIGSDQTYVDCLSNQVLAMVAGLLGGLAVESKSNSNLKGISKLFDTPETKSLNIQNLLSKLGSRVEHLLQLIYEFHNPITSDICISCLKIHNFSTRTHTEYFKKLCADKKVHFRITTVETHSNTDWTILQPLLTCSECQVLEVYKVVIKDCCKVIEKGYFQNIRLYNTYGYVDMVQFKSLLLACLYHCSLLSMRIYDSESLDRLINLLTILKQSSLNTTVKRLAIFLNYDNEETEFSLIDTLNACDICKEVLINFRFPSNLEQCKDVVDQVRKRKFKVIRRLVVE